MVWTTVLQRWRVDGGRGRVVSRKVHLNLQGKTDEEPLRSVLDQIHYSAAHTTF